MKTHTDSSRPPKHPSCETRSDVANGGGKMLSASIANRNAAYRLHTKWRIDDGAPICPRIEVAFAMRIAENIAVA